MCFVEASTAGELVRLHTAIAYSPRPPAMLCCSRIPPEVCFSHILLGRDEGALTPQMETCVPFCSETVEGGTEGGGGETVCVTDRRDTKPLTRNASRRTVATVGDSSTSRSPPPPFCRMQVFAFIRQEVARSTSAKPPKSRTSPSQEGTPNVPGGGSAKEDRGDGAEAELLEKREVVLSELPRLMELNKVGMFADGDGVGLHPSMSPNNPSIHPCPPAIHPFMPPSNPSII